MFFPDNPARATRLQNLANDISFIQASIVQIRDNIKKQNSDALDVLNDVAHDSGYKDIDELIDAAKQIMTDEQRAAIDALEKRAKDTSENLDMAYKVIGAITAIGVITRGATTARALALFDTCISFARYNMGYQGLVNGAAEIAQGLGDGAAEIEMASLSFRDMQSASGSAGAGDASSASVEAAEAGAEAAAESIEAGAELSEIAIESASVAIEAAATSAEAIGSLALRGLQVFGTAAMVLGALAALGTIIADGVTGKQQCDELVDKIHECSAKRFLTEKFNLQANENQNLLSQAISIVFEKKSFQQLVASGALSQANADAALQKSHDELLAKFVKSMVAITDDTVMNALKMMDANAKETYLHDDYQLDEITQWIKDHPTG